MDKGLLRAGAEQSASGNTQALRRKLSETWVGCDTYATLLRLYGEHRALSEGHLLHARVIVDGVQLHELSFLGNLLVQMYGRCGAMADAFSTFSHMHNTDHFSWNLLLGACSENAQHAEAHRVFNQMQIEGFLPNKHAFLSLLVLSASQNSVRACKAIHAHINGSTSVLDVVLESAIVNMYGKCQSVKDARKMFDNMLLKNVLSWNAMMTAYAQLGESTNALLLFQEMLLNGISPSRVTFVSLLDACTSLQSAELTKLMHMCVIHKAFESDIVVGTALINIYGKCGDLEEAFHMFNRLPGKGVVTWNMMIELSASHGQGLEAFHLFKEMVVAGLVPDTSTFVSILSACVKEGNLIEGRRVHFLVVSYGSTSDLVLDTALVSMYGKCRSLRDARAVYENICTCDAVAWKAMLASYIQHGEGKEALLLIQKIPPGTLLDSSTFLKLFETCATEGSLEEGRMMHALVLDSEFASDVSVGTAIVDMYSRFGKLEEAQISFKTLSQRDVVAWNAMITAYSQHGQFGEVVMVFGQMLQQGIVPNEVSFICMLKALSHAGMVVDAYLCIPSMRTFFGITLAADHCNCLLDLFGRSGWMDECERLISNVPFQPSVASWMTLLSAYRVHLNVLGGERAARHVMELEQDFGAPYVVLANLYTVTNGFPG